jgi:hypothetical protein
MIRAFTVAGVVTAFLLSLAGPVAARGERGDAERAAEALPVTLSVQLGEVELFGEAQVSGRLDPPHPGAPIQVAFLHDGKVQERRTVPMAGDGSFSTVFEVDEWGRFHAEATWEGDADHDPATASSEAKQVDAPRALHQGAKGRWVEVLEDRLDALGYYLRKPNQRFDEKTGDAVLAFHKVHGMPRSKSVSRRTWNRLTDPRTPKPRAKKPKVHIEVSQGRQVLFVVREGLVDEILHVSTGAGGATRNGVWHVHRKIAGYSPGRLYYPSYFDGNRAVHGWPDVPPTNASHGCVRVPMWAATHMHKIMHYGMEVRIYH